MGLSPKLLQLWHSLFMILYSRYILWPTCRSKMSKHSLVSPCWVWPIALGHLSLAKCLSVETNRPYWQWVSSFLLCRFTFLEVFTFYYIHKRHSSGYVCSDLEVQVSFKQVLSSLWFLRSWRQCKKISMLHSLHPRQGMSHWHLQRKDDKPWTNFLPKKSQLIQLFHISHLGQVELERLIL